MYAKSEGILILLPKFICRVLSIFKDWVLIFLLSPALFSAFRYCDGSQNIFFALLEMKLPYMTRSVCRSVGRC